MGPPAEGSAGRFPGVRRIGRAGLLGAGPRSLNQSTPGFSIVFAQILSVKLPLSILWRGGQGVRPTGQARPRRHCEERRDAPPMTAIPAPPHRPYH